MKNMKKISKRALALLLTLVMCLSLVNLSAFAVEEDSEPAGEAVEEVYTCGKEEHKHTDECYEEWLVLRNEDGDEKTVPIEEYDFDHPEEYEGYEPVLVSEQDEDEGTNTGASQDPEPGTTEPGTTEPGTTEPGTTEPGTTEPGTTEPGTTEPGTTEPGTTEPGTTEPGTTEPGTTEPGTTEPGTTEPGTTEPGTTEPGTTEPGTTEPGTTEPGTTEPGTTEPGTTEPGTTEPGTTEPGTTEPGTTEPGTTEPGTTEPAGNTGEVGSNEDTVTTETKTVEIEPHDSANVVDGVDPENHTYTIGGKSYRTETVQVCTLEEHTHTEECLAKECEHEWVDGVCTKCEAECPHEEYTEEGLCTVCGMAKDAGEDSGLYICGNEDEDHVHTLMDCTKFPELIAALEEFGPAAYEFYGTFCAEHPELLDENEELTEEGMEALTAAVPEDLAAQCNALVDLYKSIPAQFADPDHPDNPIYAEYVSTLEMMVGLLGGDLESGIQTLASEKITRYAYINSARTTGTFHFQNGWVSNPSSANWPLHFMNTSGNKYQLAYCVEPGVDLNTGNTLSSYNEAKIEAVTTAAGDHLSEAQVRDLIGWVLSNGFTYTERCSTTSDGWGVNISLSNAQKYKAIATQVLIWEVIVGERGPDFTYQEPTGNNRKVKALVASSWWVDSKVKGAYNTIVSSVKDDVRTQNTLPSFCKNNGAPEWTKSGNNYVLTLNDSNNVVHKYNYSVTGGGRTISVKKVSNNQLQLTAQDGYPTSKITLTATRNQVSTQTRTKLIVWSDGKHGSASGNKQDLVAAYTTETCNPTLITGSGTINVTARGSLRITKTATVNDSSDVAAKKTYTFIVKNSTGTIVAEKTITGNGSVTVEDLAPGDYTVTEQDAKITGYILKVTCQDQTKTISAGQTSTVTIKNEYTREKTNVTVTKDWGTTPGNYKPTSIKVELLRNGQSFTQAGINTTVTLNTDNSWTNTWSGLEKFDANGNLYTYSVKELSAATFVFPQGSNLAADERVGDLIRVRNTASPLVPELDKDGKPTGQQGHEIVGGWDVSDKGTPNENGTIKITNNWRGAHDVLNGTKFTIKKIDHDLQTPIEKVEFSLTNNQTEVVSTKSTDKNGEVTFEALTVGTYTLVELKPADGYLETEGDQGEPLMTWKVKVEKDKLVQVEEIGDNGTGDVGVNHWDLKATHNGKATMTVENTIKRGGIKITKAIADVEYVNESDFNSQTFKFQVKDADDNLVKNGDEDYWTITGTGDVTISDLRYDGTYTITEIDPDDVADYNWKGVTFTGGSVSVDGKSTTVTMVKTGVNNQTVEVNATNKYERKTGNLVISKQVVDPTSTVAEEEWFEFTVQLPGTTGEFSYTTDKGQTGAVGNNGTIKLHDGETATVTGIPVGYSANVSETGDNVQYFTVTGTNVDTDVTITEDGNVVCAFVNTRDTAPLNVTKTVTWNTNYSQNPPANSKFTFKVNLGDVEDTEANYKGVENYNNGLAYSGPGIYVLTATLTQDDITKALGAAADGVATAECTAQVITGVPTGTSYTVTEVSEGENGMPANFNLLENGIVGEGNGKTVVKSDVVGTETPSTIPSTNVTVKNRYFNSLTTEIAGYKDWGDVPEELWPEFITVELWRSANGEPEQVIFEDRVDEDGYLRVYGASGSPQWGYSFDELPMYKAENVAYEYSVKETGIRYTGGTEETLVKYLNTTPGAKAIDHIEVTPDGDMFIIYGKGVVLDEIGNDPIAREVIGAWLPTYSSGKTDESSPIDNNLIIQNKWLGSEDIGEVDFQVKKVDSDGETPLEGAEFTLFTEEEYEMYKELKPGARLLAGRTVPTDQNGIAKFTHLVGGEYVVVETKAPVGHVVNPTVWEVSVGKTSLVSVEAHVDVEHPDQALPDDADPVSSEPLTNHGEKYGEGIGWTNTWKWESVSNTEGSSIETGEDGIGTLVVMDQRIQGQITVNKVVRLDEATEAGNDAARAKVFRFNVYRVKNVFGEDVNELAATLTVRGNGSATTGLLDYGTYRIEEAGDRDLDGYAWTGVSFSSTTVNVTENGATYGVTATNTYTRETGSLVLTKVVAGGPESASTTKEYHFTVTGPDGYSQQVTITGAGSVTLDNLPTGEYSVTEDRDTAQISGYTLTISSNSPVTVAANETASITVTNTYSENPEGPGDRPDPTPDPTPTPTPEEPDIPDEPTPTTDIPEEPTPTTDIPEEEVPTTDIPEEPTPTTDIPEEDIPLVEMPEEPVPLIDWPPVVVVPEEDIPEEDVPLADVPQTGDYSLAWCAALVASIAGLAVLTLKKREDEEN